MGRKLQHYSGAPEARDAFLAELRQCGDVRVACQRAGVSKTWAYEERARRPRFAQRWTQALETYWRAYPERERQRLHLLEPYNPAYWTPQQLMQAIAHMRQRWRQKGP